MTSAKERKGSCLCGAVCVSATIQDDSVAACHCTICRKWGGGPLLAVDCGADFRIENEDNVSVYASSAWAERGFCRQCGTHLFYRLKQGPRYFVPAGVFGDGEPWALTHQIFIDEKPEFYAFANPTTNLTGAEVFAQFQSK
ncbi:MAG: GFA family protein [Betaproteobacteria bacterium]|nr:GFA family protein [Betaproteobacteria bacterium]